jgi:mRNA interferase MazF
VTTQRQTGRIPERGDVLWLTFDSTAGHEQRGPRPAMVISPRVYNGRSGLVIACPITTAIKGYTFECVLPAGLLVSGAVLADHPRTFDWRARKPHRICALPKEVTDDVLGKLSVLIGRE